MIEVKNLSAGYTSKKILKNLNFSITEGENLCILGSNGSGKTTLLRVIGGLLEYEGEVKLFDKEVKNLKPREIALKISLLSQMGSLFFSYSVYDTVMLGRYVRLSGGVFSKPSEKDEQIVIDCLNSVGICDLKDREISTLSGGQLQKVYLARCLAQEPEIIILDEPTNHLDLKSQQELFKFLKEWSQEKNHTVIGVMHDVTLAFQLFSKALFLKDGEIVFEGALKNATSEVYEKTYQTDVISYLKEIHKPLENL